VGDDLDEALARLSAFGPEFGGGLSNHGPMVVEALVSLDRQDAIAGWVDRYVARLEDPVGPTGGAPDLGVLATVGDWERQFAAELSNVPWVEVVRAWVPRLAPGLMAAATHGWLRTAHAVRALRSLETPERIAELARGLAYWAARYQDVAGPTIPSGTLSLDVALAAMPDRRAGGDGLIFESVRRLDGDAEFVAAVDAADASDLAVDSLLGAAGDAVVAGGAGDPIAYVHTLTPTAAIRQVADLVDAAVVDLVLGCAWRATAALVSTYRRPPVDWSPEVGPVDAENVIDVAVASGGEHAIKVAEAVFGPDGSTDPMVRAAGAALVARLSG
jgi:hypothetical protein